MNTVDPAVGGDKQGVPNILAKAKRLPTGKIEKQYDFFPGFIEDFSVFDDSLNKGGRVPFAIHFFDIDIMKRELELAGFEVEDLRYLDRSKDFPEFLQWDGRESLGAVGVKK